jgi:hypothetical protein
MHMITEHKELAEVLVGIAGNEVKVTVVVKNRVDVEGWVGFRE